MIILTKEKMLIYGKKHNIIEDMIKDNIGKDVVTLIWSPGVFDKNDKNIFDPQTTCCFIMQYEKSSGLVYSSYKAYENTNLLHE